LSSSLDQDGELLARILDLGFVVAFNHTGREPRSSEHSVEHILTGAQSDPIVIGGEQERNPDERPIEKLELGLGEILELVDLEFPSVLTSG
jgi:hypothetical protein